MGAIEIQPAKLMKWARKKARRLGLNSYREDTLARKEVDIDCSHHSASSTTSTACNSTEVSEKGDTLLERKSVSFHPIVRVVLIHARDELSKSDLWYSKQELWRMQTLAMLSEEQDRAEDAVMPEAENCSHIAEQVSRGTHSRAPSSGCLLPLNATEKIFTFPQGLERQKGQRHLDIDCCN